MIVLGIETSCDETAASVIACDSTGQGRLLSNIVLSQLEEHRPFGGIVPEVAARAHLQNTDNVVREAMLQADVDFDDLTAVAATGGPGLIGGVIVGVMTAKAIAVAMNIPFVAVNHLEGHALSARLSEESTELPFPYLLLLASGGHCQLLAVEGVGRYQRLGTTIDDALGEAFDKTAKMLGLGYPGGPAVERMARDGQADRFSLPRPMKGRQGCHFSFSGLKTAVRQTIEGLPEGALEQQDIADVCASFQAAAGDVIYDRTKNALEEFRQHYPDAGNMVIAGGVAANTHLRNRLGELVHMYGFQLHAPPHHLCTDNGAMIAWAACERIQKLGLKEAGDSLDFAPRPRWPLDPDAPPAAFAGVKA